MPRQRLMLLLVELPDEDPKAFVDDVRVKLRRFKNESQKTGKLYPVDHEVLLTVTLPLPRKKGT